MNDNAELDHSLPLLERNAAHEDFLVIELDERFEFGVAVIDDGTYEDNTGCNDKDCQQNGVCPG
jgi:hypothetical protein